MTRRKFSLSRVGVGEMNRGYMDHHQRFTNRESGFFLLCVVHFNKAELLY